MLIGMWLGPLGSLSCGFGLCVVAGDFFGKVDLEFEVVNVVGC